MRLWHVLPFAALMSSAAAWLTYPHIETARLWYNVTGIDVSHHQGPIDWVRVAGSGVSFAYVKLSEGGDFHDTRFEQNWSGAKNAGIPVGAYHFYRQCKSGVEQARNFLKALPADPLQLPPVLDIEHMGPCPDGTPDYDIVQEIARFLDQVQAKTGCRPLLYVTPEFDRTYISGRLTDEEFWTRSIILPPLFRRDAWVFWQYHHAGRRDGVLGPVDLNAFRGSAADFAAWIAQVGCFRQAS